MLGEISTDKSIRDASKEAEENISEHEVEQSMRKDVFDRYVALQAKLAEDGCDNAEILRSVDREVKEGWKKKRIDTLLWNSEIRKFQNYMPNWNQKCFFVFCF